MRSFHKTGTLLIATGGHDVLDTLATLYILLGAWIIVVRGPLIFAPRIVLRIVGNLFATSTQIRLIGLVGIFVATALVLLPSGSEMAAGLMRIFGLMFWCQSLWALAGANTFGRVALGILSFFENSVDDVFLRMLGLLSAVLGVGFIYVGIYVA